ncbi:MAG: TerB family tellurite resistance protein [Gammaproteobacteria bacterium]|nr:TerB family tellurite resistance protein [Gammaproteobacteria bacterium]
MLDAIKNYFEKNISPEANGDLEHELKLATAALLIEMMYQDDQVHEKEINAAKKALTEKFGLTDDEYHTLFALAEEEVKEAIDYHQFTSLIAREFTQAQKIKVVELLWSVAYADSHLDSMEEHMVRKIADLIYVSHKDFMKTKHKVQSALVNTD